MKSFNPLLSKIALLQGLFTNYVKKRRGLGGTKKLIFFVKVYKVENVNGGESVVEKAKNLST